MRAEGFLPTPSARRATKTTCKAASLSTDFYPRPPRGGRLIVQVEQAVDDIISTHALREEGDRGRDSTPPLALGFLPTPSARRATDSVPLPGGETAYFYPRPPRGGRLNNLEDFKQRYKISTHALREEGDLFKWGGDFYK